MLTGNSAEHGGGASEGTLHDCTLSGNSATLNGGGIRNQSAAQYVKLYNTIVANSPTGGNCAGTITDGSGNLSYPDTTCPGINSGPVVAGVIGDRLSCPVRASACQRIVGDPTTTPAPTPLLAAAMTTGWGFVTFPQNPRHPVAIFDHGTIPAEVMNSFCPSNAFIYFLEIIAQIIPVLALSEALSPHFLSTVDNEASKHALIKGCSNVTSVNNLVSTFWCFCARNLKDPWFERVSSKANIADSVSRGDFFACH